MSLLTYRAPAVQWRKKGQVVSGPVVDVEEVQETQFKTQAPLYWGEKRGDGKVTTPTGPTGKALNPCMQLVVTVATGKTDPGIPNDTGERRVFMKGQMLAAMKTACREHRIREYEELIDAGIEVTFESEKPSDGGYDQKIFAVKLTPAPPKPKAGGLLTDDQPDEDQGDAQPAGETWIDKEKAKTTARKSTAASVTGRAKRAEDDEPPL